MQRSNKNKEKLVQRHIGKWSHLFHCWINKNIIIDRHLLNLITRLTNYKIQMIIVKANALDLNRIS